MKRIVIFLSGILLVLGMVLPAMATTISYKLSELSGGNYRYDYTVTNNTLSQPLQDFLVYFPAISSNFSSKYHLTSGFAPTGWKTWLTAHSGLKQGGIYEAYNGSIAIGSSLSGFGVQFTYDGSAPLGSQYFEVDDPISFSRLEFGSTTLAAGGAPVPEPATIILFALGLAGFGVARKKGNKTI